MNRRGAEVAEDHACGTDRRNRRSELVEDALLAGAVLVAYANALGGAFQFDDYTVIVDNPAVWSLEAWAASMPGIRPLLKLTYALNWSTGLGAAGFHAVNVLCHVTAALLVMRLCRRVVPASPGLAPLTGPMAFTASLIFALHPVQTEAVTYLSGRSMSLMAALYLGAVVVQLASGGFLAGRVASAALFALALATKETAVTLPAALILLDRALGTPWRESLRRTLSHWVVLGAALLAGLATPGYGRLLAFSLSIRTVAENLLTQIDGIGYLLTRPLLLLRTNIDPPLDVQTSLTLALAVQGGLLLLSLAAGVVLFRRSAALGAAVLWLFLHLAPTNSVLPRLDVANDRQLYLALLGPALLAAAAIWRGLPRAGAVAATCTLALVLAAATVVRNADYRTEVALWTATVRGSPQSARAWNNLGYACQLAGDVAAAREAYERALALDPGAFRARWNLERMREAKCEEE
jgi:tetratricopeptide (TPR) repeat protein